MENRNLLYGIIAILIIAVIGLAIDRSNQITSLTEQNELAATESENLNATIEAQTTELDAQMEAAESNASELNTLATQVAVSSTEFESQIADLSDASSVLETDNADLSTQVADLSVERDDLEGQANDLMTQVAEQANIAETQAAVIAEAQQDAVDEADNAATQAAIAATAQQDAVDQANFAATYEAENQALQTQVAEMMPEPTETLEPTEAPTEETTASNTEMPAPEMTELEFVFQEEVDTRGVVQISPNNNSVAVLRADNTIEFFSAVDGTSQLELSDFDGELSDFAYTSTDRAIVALSDDNSVIVFDSASGMIAFEQTASNPVTGYDLSEDNNAIIVGTPRNIEISVLDSGRNQTRQGGVTALDWSADGTRIVVTNGRTVTVFDIEDYTISGSTDLDSATAQIVDVRLSPDGAYVAGTTVDAELVILSVESGDVVWQTYIDADAIDDVVWSADSSRIAAVANGDIRVYSVDGSWVAHAMLDGVTSVDWSANGEFLAFASADQVSVVETSTLMN